MVGKKVLQASKSVLECFSRDITRGVIKENLADILFLPRWGNFQKPLTEIKKRIRQRFFTVQPI
jgi:hypothetical protein